MALTAQVNGNITITDSSSGGVALVKVLASLLFPGTQFAEAQAATIGASPTSITLPVSPTQFVYIKNLHATNTLTVTWTPNAGVSAVICTLQPGSAIFLIEAATGSGITALSLQASGAGTNVEYLLLG